METCVGKFVFVALLAFSSCLLAVQSLEDTFEGKGNNYTRTMKNTSAFEGENSLTIRQMYKDFEKELKSAVSSAIRKSTPTVMREIYSRNLSLQCLSSLLQLTGALKQAKLWAFQFLDATGKIPEGFLSGTFSSLGNYDECVGIDVNQPKVKVKGQYCVIEIFVPLPKWRPYMPALVPLPELRNVSGPDTVFSFLFTYLHDYYIASAKTSLCLPTDCSKDDIDKLLQIIPDKLDLPSDYWKLKVKSCETRDSFEFSSIQMCIMYFFILIVIIVVIATVADIIFEEEFTERENVTGNIFRLLRCFSLRFNMKLISAYTGPEKDLRFVYGFMYICICWTFPAFLFANMNFAIASNYIAALDMAINTIYGFITSKAYPCQALLFLSAFVTTYQWMKSPEEKLCVWKFFLKAYIRYTPVYMLLIGLLMLMPAWSSGPTWMAQMNPTYTNCKANWWTNLLYINNVINTDKMCIAHSWFFAVAAQLHSTAPLVLVPIKTKPKIALLVNFILGFGSLIIVFVANLWTESPPSEVLSFLSHSDMQRYGKATYYRSYYHLTVYCCGIFAGYLTATRPNMKISAKLSYFLWILSLTVVVPIFYLITQWNGGALPNPLISATFDALSKLGWGLVLLWATISCATERKGIFYDIMSWEPFSFLSRLVFIMMVISSAVINMILSHKRSHLHSSHFEIFYNVGGVLVTTHLVAYVFYVFVESPFLQLTQVLKKTCGIKTFTSSVSAIDSSSFPGAKVISEKLTNTKAPKYSIEKLVTEKNTD